ncbi:hypothetical protein ENBRE01_1217 [Enteropsectra breve]|nr:hypothetical protein ENBRE01_1217 [Enteropsectra breve]
MKKNELEEYINAIDLSMATDRDVIGNIFAEIGEDASYLATSALVSTNLERLIGLSFPEHIVPFLKKMSPKIIYKKLGSRMYEAAYRRLFECMYINKETVALEEAMGTLDAEACINCRNATHVLRECIMLLSAKKIRNRQITRYKMDESNRAFAEKTLGAWKQVFVKELPNLAENDSFSTILVYLQATKSQSLISEILEKDCTIENIKKRDRFYEGLPALSNRVNLEMIYQKIKKNVMELSSDEKTNYFMQEYLRHSARAGSLFRRIALDKFEADSNVVLALLEGLVANGCHSEIQVLLKDFYECQKDVFSELLLKKYGAIDTKFVAAIAGLMRYAAPNDCGTNSDFVALFKKEWLRTKGGRTLIDAFVSGGSDASQKSLFFDKTIDCLWGCTEWDDGKRFIKSVTEVTSGHTRKKAFDILKKFR